MEIKLPIQKKEYQSFTNRLRLLEIQVKQLTILMNRIIIDDEMTNQIEAIGQNYEPKKEDDDSIGFKQN